MKWVKEVRNEMEWQWPVHSARTGDAVYRNSIYPYNVRYILWRISVYGTVSSIDRIT
jgi:hypothetical protein